MKSYHKWFIFGLGGAILLAALFSQFGLDFGLSNRQKEVVTIPVSNSTQITYNNSTKNTTQAITPSVAPSVTPSVAPKPTYTLLFFEQPNCPACSAMKPKIDAWIKDNPRVTLKDIDITKDLATAGRYAVRATPTTIFTNAKGDRLDTTVGEFDTAQLTEWLNIH